MPYRANKCVRFDRVYTVGAIIDDNVVDRGMEKYLIGIGLVEKIDPTSASGAENSSNPKRVGKPRKGEASC